MSKKTIQDCIKDNLESYFHDLRGAEPHSLHLAALVQLVDRLPPAEGRFDA